MYFTFKSRHLVAAAIFMICAAAISAQPAAAAKEKARKGPASAADLKKLVEQVDAQREKMIAEHDALAKQLKDATEEDRKKIMEKMREQKKAFEEAQSALHKRIRDDLRQQRQNMGSGRR